MASVVAEMEAGLILMHMRGTPRTMQKAPRYDDVVGEVCASLQESIQTAEAEGVAAERIIIDPGIGFGKTTEHNIELLKRLTEFRITKQTTAHRYFTEVVYRERFRTPCNGAR